MRSIGYDVRGKPSGKKSIHVVAGGPGDVQLASSMYTAKAKLHEHTLSRKFVMAVQ